MKIIIILSIFFGIVFSRKIKSRTPHDLIKLNLTFEDKNCSISNNEGLKIENKLDQLIIYYNGSKNDEFFTCVNNNLNEKIKLAISKFDKEKIIFNRKPSQLKFNSIFLTPDGNEGEIMQRDFSYEDGKNQKILIVTFSNIIDYFGKNKLNKVEN